MRLTLPQALVLIVIRDDLRHFEGREFRALRTLKRLGCWEFALDEKKCGRKLTPAGAEALATFYKDNLRLVVNERFVKE